MATPASTGIIIGRFQVFELNKIQKDLIDSVRKKHQKVIFFLGSNPAPSDANPLNWELRKQMLQETFPTAMPVFEMPDLQDDRIWSQELDRRIMGLHPKGKVTLYGSSDGFVDHYQGRFETTILEAAIPEIPIEHSSSEAKESARDFRAGIIYATNKRFPTVYPTVDVAVFRSNYQELLIARKENEIKFRLPGGFTDPEDESFEMAAMRELQEECGAIEITDFRYLGSSRIHTWRYQGSKDGIITHLYACELLAGEPEPHDDICELRWVEIDKLQTHDFVPEHQPLFRMLTKFWKEEM